VDHVADHDVDAAAAGAGATVLDVDRVESP